jgi:hypothetical protein
MLGARTLTLMIMLFDFPTKGIKRFNTKDESHETEIRKGKSCIEQHSKQISVLEK